ncbi:MAG: hypothetical protein IID33_18275, partial [Planctomycetes bacterium]|nr:hypothetical protein [Planctomycetota bacterium]
MAELMPRGTLLYIGWADLMDEDEWRMQSQMLHSIVSFAAKQAPDDPDFEMIKKMFRIAEPIARSPGGIGLFELRMSETGPDVQIGAVIDAGAKSAELLAIIEEFIAEAPQDITTSDVTVKGASLKQFTIPGMPLEVLWGVHEERFLLCLGQGAAEKIIDRINGQGDSLADNDDLQFHRKKTKTDLASLKFCLYADVRQLIAKAKTLAGAMMIPMPPMVDTLLAELGIDSVRSKSIHADAPAGIQRLNLFARIDGPWRGLLKLWEQKAVTDDDLKMVPRDAYWMDVVNFDLDAFYKELVRVVTAVEPSAAEMIEGFVGQSAAMLGMSITDDLLPALGDTWTFFDAPAHGAILGTGTVAIIETRNPEVINKLIDNIQQLVAPMLTAFDVSLVRNETKVGKHTLHYITIGGLPIPVAPAWAAVGDRFIFGLYPQCVSAALKQVDPATRGASILDRPEFAQAKTTLLKNVMAVSYVDSKYFASWGYAFNLPINTAIMSMGSDAESPIDLSLIPTLAETLAALSNMVGTSSRDDDGILYSIIGSGSSPLVVVGAVAAVVATGLPALTRARHLAKRTVSHANLRGVGQACHIYAIDNGGRFPASFDELIELGLASHQQLMSPRDPTARLRALGYIGDDEPDAAPVAGS